MVGLLVPVSVHMALSILVPIVAVGLDLAAIRELGVRRYLRLEARSTVTGGGQGVRSASGSKLASAFCQRFRDVIDIGVE